MSDNDKQIAREAANKLLAVADGATLEWVYDGTRVETAWPQLPLEVLGGDKVRIRPPAAPPEPKPSQAVLEACKRLGVEPWKLGRFLKGDRILGNGYVLHGYDGYIHGCATEWVATCDQVPENKALYWHVRHVAQTAPPSLPCPPRPTDDQVAAARLNGKRVRLVGVCEEPNGRPWFTSGCFLATPYQPVSPMYSRRRWIAEVVEDEPRPWDLDPKHAHKVVERKDGSGWGSIDGVRDRQFVIPGWGKVTPAELLRDWTHNGQPCGDVS